MENGDTEKYHPSSVIQDFVFSSRKSSCIRCISLQVYNKFVYQTENNTVGTLNDQIQNNSVGTVHYQTENNTIGIVCQN